jgi:hypothetical protein
MADCKETIQGLVGSMKRNRKDEKNKLFFGQEQGLIYIHPNKICLKKIQGKYLGTFSSGALPGLAERGLRIVPRASEPGQHRYK